MSTSYYIIEKKECSGCANRGLYDLNSKNPWHCYHPSRAGSPFIKYSRGELKECKLLKEK